MGYCIAGQTAVNTLKQAVRRAFGVARKAQHSEKCGCIGVRKCKMWTLVLRSLAPDSSHIVAFRLSDTTFRAADCH